MKRRDFLKTVGLIPLVGLAAKPDTTQAKQALETIREELSKFDKTFVTYKLQLDKKWLEKTGFVSTCENMYKLNHWHYDTKSDAQFPGHKKRADLVVKNLPFLHKSFKVTEILYRTYTPRGKMMSYLHGDPHKNWEIGDYQMGPTSYELIITGSVLLSAMNTTFELGRQHIMDSWDMSRDGYVIIECSWSKEPTRMPPYMLG